MFFVAFPLSLVLHPIRMQVYSNPLLTVLYPITVVAFSICECQGPNAVALVVLEHAIICRPVTEVEDTFAVLLTINFSTGILPTIATEVWSVAEDVFNPKCLKVIRRSFAIFMLFSGGEDRLFLFFSDWEKRLRLPWVKCVNRFLPCSLTCL